MVGVKADMSKVFLSFFICLSLTVFSQSPVIKITEAKLKEAKSVKDIIPGLEACNIKSFLICFTVAGQAKEYENQKEFFDTTGKSLITARKKGKFFFIEKIKSDCFPRAGIKVIVE